MTSSRGHRRKKDDRSPLVVEVVCNYCGTSQRRELMVESRSIANGFWCRDESGCVMRAASAHTAPLGKEGSGG